MAAAYLTLTAARQRNRSQSKWHHARIETGMRPRVVTACSGLRVDENETVRPSGIPVQQRCRAAGCRQAWANVPEPTTEVS